MTEKRQTLQGYIIRILQHFATKLWNITNFVMLFQAVMKFLSRLVEFKILVNWGMVHLNTIIINAVKLMPYILYSNISKT
jgi:valyl-tRNA synthetase